MLNTLIQVCFIICNFLIRLFIKVKKNKYPKWIKKNNGTIRPTPIAGTLLGRGAYEVKQLFLWRGTTMTS